MASELGISREEDVALFLGDRSQVLDEHGFLDPDKARRRSTGLAETRPYLVARRSRSRRWSRAYYPNLHGGARQLPPPEPSFGRLLKDVEGYAAPRAIGQVLTLTPQPQEGTRLAAGSADGKPSSPS